MFGKYYSNKNDHNNNNKEQLWYHLGYDIRRVRV